MTRAVRDDLRSLARMLGIQTSYLDIGGVRRFASRDALVGVLRALGVPIDSATDARAALHHHEARRTQPHLEPVHVAWDGTFPALRGRFPSDRVDCRLTLESGETLEWKAQLAPASVPGKKHACQAGFHRSVPIGYHTLEIHSGNARFDTTIIAAPTYAFVPAGAPRWGLFLPLHAARSSGHPGASDYRDLDALARWTGSLGGELFGTLPLLPTFLRAPFEPSPYAPASRLFWSDFFIAVDRLPGADSGSTEPSHGRALRDPLAAAGAQDLVDYRAVAELRRRVIDEVAQRFFEQRGEQDPGLAEYLARTPLVRDYARFRAVLDREGRGWTRWPERPRAGAVQPEDYDARDERYHLYAAWVADAQIATVAGARATGAAGLYLDLPLGVHRDGFDAWRFRDLFAPGVSAGAPPDPFFPQGQNWGFAPLHPEAARADAHRYTIECLRHHMRYASALRVDHVMSLHRLFWIPQGMDARQGVYVRYPLDELTAILTLESTRNHVLVVGEDLGTVPRAVRAAMERHHLHRMFVFQFETTGRLPLPVDRARRSAVASLNTHDMPTFGAFWDALDLEDRQRLGHLSADAAAAEADLRAALRQRIASALGLRTDAGAGPVLIALLESLARSRARILLINLEDLWLETQPQNVPGTSTERPNWRRRARLTIEQTMNDASIVALLRRIASLRASGIEHA